MAITYEDLLRVNESLATVPIKGKDYVQVNERVKAFRQICPNGSIQTEIIDMTGKLVTMKATVCDADGKVLGTGLAQENQDSSFINKTSYIENCETSAVGRALGFVGIGVDGSMCSAEELVNAINNQNDPKKSQPAKQEVPQTISKKEQAILKAMCDKKGLDINNTFPNGIENLTGEQYAEAIKKLGNLKDKE